MLKIIEGKQFFAISTNKSPAESVDFEIRSFSAANQTDVHLGEAIKRRKKVTFLQD